MVGLEHLDVLFSAVGEEHAARKKLGLLLVNSSFVLMHATERANRFVANGRLGIQDGVLRCLDSEDQQALERLLPELRASEVASDEQGASIDLLVGRQTRFPLLMSILPAARRRSDSAAPSARDSAGDLVVVLRSPRQAQKSDVVRLMRIFALTEREGQLALHLATGGRLSEFAQERHLAMNTVKTHLKQVFKKLAANSQLRVAIMVISALN